MMVLGWLVGWLVALAALVLPCFLTVGFCLYGVAHSKVFSVVWYALELFFRLLTRKPIHTPDSYSQNSAPKQLICKAYILVHSSLCFPQHNILVCVCFVCFFCSCCKSTRSLSLSNTTTTTTPCLNCWSILACLMVCHSLNTLLLSILLPSKHYGLFLLLLVSS
jgi:hypothetical protein